MLDALHIQNFAIIEDLTVQFGPGLNVLTGETGAGKSILIGAIQLLLGAKGEIDQIREGAEAAVVEGLFTMQGDPSVGHNLDSQGISTGDQVVLRRVLPRSGKSRAYINDRFSTIQNLSDLGRCWVNIYGQHEHQSLLQADRHIELLDEYGGLRRLRERWNLLWAALGRVKDRIQEAESSIQEAEARRELWAFQCREIEGAKLHPGEEASLEHERRVLLHAHRILDALSRAEDMLYGDAGSAMERIQVVLRELRELTSLDQGLASVADPLAEASLHLEEGIGKLRDRARGVEINPERLVEVEERLGEIQRLKRKYKKEVPEIIALCEDLQQRLREMEKGEETIESLWKQKEELERDLMSAGGELNRARRKAAERLSREVERELGDLGIARPVFQVAIGPLEEGEALGNEGMLACGRGMDRVAFLLSTNPGESPRPIHRIASGGELSRIMLALKKVLAEAERIHTLVFDEIDSGIGGAVAQALGEKLALISRNHQVLCITHLPQIACYAKNHFQVTKVSSSGRTIARVKPLSMEERVEEISRMLGGKHITDRTRAHAEELLQGAGAANGESRRVGC